MKGLKPKWFKGFQSLKISKREPFLKKKKRKPLKVLESNEMVPGVFISDCFSIDIGWHSVQCFACCTLK